MARLDRIRREREWLIPGTVERAYQLAPQCRTIDELRAKLVKEHCTNVEAHLQGSLRKELSKLLKKTD
jgi:hypothetical protein